MNSRGNALCGAFLILAAACSCAASVNTNTWVEVRSPNFRVISNGGEKKAREVAVHFEQIRTVYRASLPFAAAHPSPLITIFAAKDEKSLGQLLPDYWGKERSHPAGLFVEGQQRYYILLSTDVPGPNPYVVIFHEYFHSLTLPYYPDMPLWLAEGLADFYANAEIDSKEVGLGMPNMGQLRVLQEQRILPLDVLFRVDQSSPYYSEKNKTSIFYAESWALTHYLLLADNQSHRKILADFLSHLDRGEPIEQAELAAFGDMKQFQKQFNDYTNRHLFNYVKYPAPPQVSGNDYPSRVLSPAEAVARIGDSFVCRNRPQEARPFLEQALALDPKLPLAHEAMGLLYLTLNEREQACQSFAKAIELDPNNFLTRYYYAILSPWPELGTANPELEREFRRSIELNPDFAPSHEGLARAEANGNHNLPDALQLAKKAQQLRPGELHYVMTMARILLQMGKTAEAVAVARQGQAFAHRPGERDELESFFELAQKVEAMEKTKRERAQASKSDSASEEDDDSAAGDNVPPYGATPLKATSWGQIKSVRCEGAGINLILENEQLTVQLHAADYEKIKIELPRELRGGVFHPCEQLEGWSAAIVYTMRGNVIYRGEILGIELKNKPASNAGNSPPDRHIRSRATSPSSETSAVPVAVKVITTGKITAVTCEEDELEMTLTSASAQRAQPFEAQGKQAAPLHSLTMPIALHARNYRNIEFYSLNWTAPDNFNPCTQLNGLTAKIQYSIVSGKPYAGEIITLEVEGQK